MRISNRRAIYSDTPFSGDGYNLYVNQGDKVQYRNHRLLGRNFGPALTGKGAAVGTITPGGTFALPAGLLDQQVSFDVRRFKDHVENETSNYRHVTLDVDGSGDGESTIYGTASIISQEIKAGGIVSIRMRYFPAATGIQPDLFRLVRTAGPTSPADVVVNTVVFVPTVIEFDTAALSDSSAYTFTIRAENGVIVSDLITDVSVTADATGPTAPSTAVAQPW